MLPKHPKNAKLRKAFTSFCPQIVFFVTSKLWWPQKETARNSRLTHCRKVSLTVKSFILIAISLPHKHWTRDKEQIYPEAPKKKETMNILSWSSHGLIARNRICAKYFSTVWLGILWLDTGTWKSSIARRRLSIRVQHSLAGRGIRVKKRGGMRDDRNYDGAMRNASAGAGLNHFDRRDTGWKWENPRLRTFKYAENCDSNQAGSW